MLITFRGNTPMIHESCFIEPSARIIGDVNIGANSSVWFNAIVRGDINYIRIGENTNIQDACIVHVTSGRFPTIIGNNVTLGHGAIVHGSRIGDGSLISMGCIVLDNCDIGENVIIGAGSVVTEGSRIPSNTLVLGAPARVKRQLTDRDLQKLKNYWSEYVSLKDEYMAEEYYRKFQK